MFRSLSNKVIHSRRQQKNNRIVAAACFGCCNTEFSSRLWPYQTGKHKPVKRTFRRRLKLVCDDADQPVARSQSKDFNQMGLGSLAELISRCAAPQLWQCGFISDSHWDRAIFYQVRIRVTSMGDVQKYSQISSPCYRRRRHETVLLGSRP
jgi:hypothetical protein